MIRNAFWYLFAILCSVFARPIIAWAKRTPYVHLSGYMKRWWLFNRYDVPRGWLRKRLPSVRIHCILREDDDRHLHDHPWDARTIILRGAYWEVTQDGSDGWRVPGDTRAIRYGEYHRISLTESDDGDEGVYTMFITWKYIGTWGFLVNGEKVPHKVYLGIDD